MTWKSKKQTVVAKNSVEAEFRVVAHGICKLLWLKKLLKDLKVTSPMPMKLYCDNKVAIIIAHNLVQHDITKQAVVDRHFIKEKLYGGVDPHFSRASPLDRRESLFICEKLIFRKKSWSRHLFYFYFKGKIKQEIKP